MESQYFYLGLLAMMAAAAGVVGRALHVSRVTNRRLSAERVYLQRELELRKKTAAESQDEAERNNALVRLLDQQVQQRCSEIDTLRMLLLRRDQEIRLLRKEADRTRFGESISGQAEKTSGEISGQSASTGDQTGPTPGPERLKPLISPEEQRALLSPARRSDSWPMTQDKRYAEVGGARNWKDSMDRMLGVLDAIDREVSE